MTNIRARGFDTQSQLQEYLADLDDDAPVDDDALVVEEGPSLEGGDRAAELEISLLRSELADLRERLAAKKRQSEEAFKLRNVTRPWLGIAATITSIFALGIVASRLYVDR